MRTFGDTDIEMRVSGKSELVQQLGISRRTLYFHLVRIEHKLLQAKGYNRRAKLLYVHHIRIILEEIGMI